MNADFHTWDCSLLLFQRLSVFVSVHQRLDSRINYRSFRLFSEQGLAVSLDNVIGNRHQRIAGGAVGKSLKLLSCC
jgi:hypothetical protein